MPTRVKLYLCVYAALIASIPASAAPLVVSQATGGHLIRLAKSDLATAATLAIDANDAMDYGRFVWIAVSDTQLADLRDAGVPLIERQDPYVIRLGEISFDPLDGEPLLPAGWDQVSSDGPDLQLVQFDGPTRGEWIDGLTAQGLEVVQFIYPSTYVVWGDMASRDAASWMEPVRWTGPFAPAYRVLPKFRSLPDEPQDMDVLLYRGADTDAVVEQFRQLGARVRGRHVLNGVFEEVGLSLAGPAVQLAAQIPGVYSIQKVPTDGGLRGEMTDQMSANNHDGSNQVYPGYLDWLATVGVDGSGVIIANVDGGISQTHADLVNRMVGCSGPTCGGSASSSHGTHTAGIMAADGSSGTLDGFGFLRGLGQAPGANLVEQVYNPFFTQPGGMLLLMTDSQRNAASLSGNSWGPSGSPQGYDDDTMQVDIGVRDADPDAPGNQPLSYVLSFMNGNGGTSTQGTPDEAKNLFNIGSTKAQTSGGVQILQIDDLSANTAHGPALDGRTIPHMVAPGCSVDSTIPTGYGLLCGTSMASPHVSGAVALFIEYYRGLDGYVADPSPALVKAAFLPVAHDLAGHLDADGGVLGHPFDSKQGWGRMDLEAVIAPSVAVRYFDNPVVFDNTGEEWQTTVSPQDTSQPMRIMLVWTDAPGHGLGGSTPAWNNDLDLAVDVGGTTYYGNVFDTSGWSTSGGSPDYRNNTEGVLLGPTAPGGATIRVIASDINSDGIPGEGDATDQDFAIACYNCALEPGFVLSATPGSATICAPSDAVYDIDVTQIMGYTDPVTLSASGEPAGTSVNFSVNPVMPPGTSVMTVTGTGGAAAGDYSITVTGTAATITRDTGVGLSIYTAAAGDVTLVSPPDGAVDVSARPEFTWDAAAQASTYEFELASDAGFANIIDSASNLTETTYLPSVTLDVLTTYYWRVRALNICGVGNDSAVFSFTTRDQLPVLLVDDDDNSPNVQGTYTAALDALGQTYDVWNTNNSDNEPDAATLAQYGAVIWFTGDEFGGSAGPGSAGESALGSFLDGGGCLFITSQDYFYDRGLTGFMQSYLGTASVTSDINQTTVTGAGSVFGGLGPFTLSYPFSNFSDRVNPDATAELAFSGNAGNAAVNKDDGVYRTTFWGFPWEAASEADRLTLMTTVLDWCAAPRIVDCNNNGIDDSEDIANCTGDPACADCNTNGIPDGCEADCDANGLPDECEIASCAGDPACADCDGNAIPDGCDIAGGAADCDTDGVPDACQMASCGGDPACGDCNANGTMDGCDLSAGSSDDANTNDVPDECEIAAPTAGAEGSRYLGINALPVGSTVPVALWIGGDAGDPDVSCVSAYVQADGTLGASPVYQTPDVWGDVHARGDEIIPSAAYQIRAELPGGFVTATSSGTTWLWGDADDNGLVNFIDIELVVAGFQGDFSRAPMEAVDLDPCMPNRDVNFEDINRTVMGFQGLDYTAGGCAVPCN